jgi:hypothetical protein
VRLLDIPCFWGITMLTQEKGMIEGLQKIIISMVLISHTIE